MIDIPEDLRYTKEHEWARQEGESVRVGITKFAVKQLGDVTLVDLPQVGQELRGGDAFGEVESVKTVSQLFAPLSGKVTAVNSELLTHPERVNDDCYGDGWLLLIEAESPEQLSQLLDAPSYASHVASLDD